MKTKCKISIGFFAVTMLLALWLTRSDYLLPLVLSVIIHEFGHVLAARICKVRFCKLKLGIFGAALFPENTTYSYGTEIIICLGGPAFNFATAFWGCIIPSNSHFWQTFILSSLCLGAVNLLPILGFDGGRIFLSILSLVFSPDAAHKLIRIISFVLIFCLWSFSVYLLIRVAASLSLFIFSVSLFVKIFVPNTT